MLPANSHKRRMTRIPKKTKKDDDAATADPKEAPKSPTFVTNDPLINDARLSNPLLADDLHGII